MVGQRKGEESVNYNGFLGGNMVFISGVCHEKKKVLQATENEFHVCGRGPGGGCR